MLDAQGPGPQRRGKKDRRVRIGTNSPVPSFDKGRLGSQTYRRASRAELLPGGYVCNPLTPPQNQWIPQTIIIDQQNCASVLRDERRNYEENHLASCSCCYVWQCCLQTAKRQFGRNRMWSIIPGPSVRLNYIPFIRPR